MRPSPRGPHTQRCVGDEREGSCPRSGALVLKCFEVRIAERPEVASAAIARALLLLENKC